MTIDVVLKRLDGFIRRADSRYPGIMRALLAIAMLILPPPAEAAWLTQKSTDPLTDAVSTYYEAPAPSIVNPDRHHSMIMRCVRNEPSVYVVFDGYFAISSDVWHWSVDGVVKPRASASSAGRPNLSTLLYTRDTVRFMRDMANGKDIRVQVSPNYGRSETVRVDTQNVADTVAVVLKECGQRR